MRILLAGLGSIGQRHLRNLLSLGVTDLILHRTGKAQLANPQLARFPTFVDLADGLALRPDAVVVSNPTALHPAVAIPAARQGCALLIEKPVAGEWPPAVELKRAAGGGRRILVGYQFRFHPTLQRLRGLVQDGELGEIITAQASWGESLPSWHLWEDYRTSYAARRDLGGGAILTLSHPLDYLAWIFGPVTTVTASAGNSGRLGLEVEDSAEIILGFDGGPSATVHLDFLHMPAEHSLTLLGTQGKAVWDAEQGSLRWQHAGHGLAWREDLPPVGFERNTMFLEEMRHFLEVVKGSEASACSLREGLDVLRVGLAALQSSATGDRISLDGFDPPESSGPNLSLASGSSPYRWKK